MMVPAGLDQDPGVRGGEGEDHGEVRLDRLLHLGLGHDPDLGLSLPM